MKNAKDVHNDLAGGILTIDLGAMQDNWRTLARLVAPARCGAAIKGDAYGLGLHPVARALWFAGCKDYFVARPTEGEELREILPDATIYVLDGFYAGQGQFYVRNRLVPTLVSLGEAKEWAHVGMKRPCAIHVDTGIHRLGFSADEFRVLCADTEFRKSLNIKMVVSHLACSDERDHPLNVCQLNTFSDFLRMMPNVQASLANSCGIYLGADYHHDVVRAGVALYGGNPLAGRPNPMKTVVTLQAKVMQTRFVKMGETIGYGATWTASRDSRIAILGAGYRDGIPRKLSSLASSGPMQVCITGRRVPIVGRVSMDMMAIDVTDIPENETPRGTLAELFGPNISLDDAARSAGTISYELLTHLGNRYARNYTGTGL